MSTTVAYKGNTLTTVNNATKTLKTAGKYMEGDVVLTDTTVDLSSDTVTPDTLMQGYTAHNASGALIVGTHEDVDGDLLAYGLGTSPLVNVAKTETAILTS